MKENIVKWLPIVKRNREADSIDFTDKTPRDILRLYIILKIYFLEIHCKIVNYRKMNLHRKYKGN